ncbi:MAG: hypothetical protein KC445_07305 [Anaerolineales bacterium]|nr:hypothetical protein [Anaerolineales bacterium]
MAIDFSSARWQQVKETYRQWWSGELERPIVPIQLAGRDPGRPEPKTPLLTQATCTDFSYSPEAIIDRIDYELSRYLYLGDAFPYFNMDCFGPGILAGMLGAQVDNGSGRVWFFPEEKLPISEIHFAFDPENMWYRRLREIYAAGMARWQGIVLLGMTDLGGNLDVLSTFRPSEQLLFDLYDHPEEVKRLTWEAHEAWHQAYAGLNEVLQPLNPGYSDWSGIYSDVPSYMLQSDFCYMISPAMFEEFVKPELSATCQRLPRCFYHLDGVGQIRHLPSLLEIEALDGCSGFQVQASRVVVNGRNYISRFRRWGRKFRCLRGALTS